MQQFSKLTPQLFYNRLLQFAIQCNKLVYKLPKTDSNRTYGIQLIRSSSSPGANYIEVIEAISSKDFAHRLKICRKEAKESIHWLTLIQVTNETQDDITRETKELIQEANEFIRIFTASILTSEKNRSNP